MSNPIRVVMRGTVGGFQSRSIGIQKQGSKTRQFPGIGSGGEDQGAHPGEAKRITGDAGF